MPGNASLLIMAGDAAVAIISAFRLVSDITEVVKALPGKVGDARLSLRIT